MAIHPITAISLFSGGAMLDVGVELAFGEIFDCIAYVECEAHAVAVLAAAMEQGRLDKACLWSDVRSVCGPQFRHYIRSHTGESPVGAFIAGYPCPDFSVAGKRAGMDGVKGSLWFALARAIEAYQPELLFLENVGGHTSKGFDTVCESLQAMGYRIAAGLFTASETGASHKRERLFILADKHVDGRPRSEKQYPRSRPGLEDTQRRNPERCNPQLADAIRRGTTKGPLFRRGYATPRREKGFVFQSVLRGHKLEDAPGRERRPGRQANRNNRSPGQPHDNADRSGGELGNDTSPRFACGQSEKRQPPQNQRRPGELVRRCHNVAFTARPELYGRFGEPTETSLGYESGPERYCFPIFAPGPDDIEQWQRILEIDPSLEPAICSVANGMANRTQQLRMLGNGVVALQAAYAFTTLAACLWSRR